MTKGAAGYDGHCRVATRNVRRDGMDTIKKAKGAGMAEDDQNLWESEVQAMADAQIKMIDVALNVKQAEIMRV